MDLDGTGADLVFVGGTGRSGTTVVGELLGAHEHWIPIPIEIRFHIDNPGLCEVLSSECTVEQFRQRMLTKFYKRRSQVGVRGLHSHVRYDDLEAALDRFEERFSSDRLTAAKELLIAVLTLGWGRRRGWVEHTPGTAQRWDSLSRIVPHARLVHTVRDGRDVAASVARMKWGPDNLVDALYWWDGRLRRSEAARRLAPPGSVFVLPFEGLFGDEREAWLERLFAFTGIEPDSSVRQFLEDVSPERAHIGVWRQGLSNDEQRRIDDLYTTLLKDLEADDVVSRPRVDLPR